jgi:hypothetical protein
MLRFALGSASLASHLPPANAALRPWLSVVGVASASGQCCASPLAQRFCPPREEAGILPHESFLEWHVVPTNLYRKSFEYKINWDQFHTQT